MASREAFLENQRLLNLFIEDQQNFDKINKVAEAMAQAFSSGNKILSCGNGGSACDAMHFAQEFTGKFRKERKGLPVISLADPTHITCVGNDYGFDHIFSRGVEAFGQQGDFLVGMSTSGNSPNVLKAVEMAKEKGVISVCLLGRNGGKLKGMGEYEWIIPGTTSDRIQEIHMIILHTIIEMVERKLFPENYAG